jgi:hypothetical protein
LRGREGGKTGDGFFYREHERGVDGREHAQRGDGDGDDFRGLHEGTAALEDGEHLLDQAPHVHLGLPLLILLGAAVLLYHRSVCAFVIVERAVGVQAVDLQQRDQRGRERAETLDLVARVRLLLDHAQHHPYDVSEGLETNS